MNSDDKIAPLSDKEVKDEKTFTKALNDSKGQSLTDLRFRKFFRFNNAPKGTDPDHPTFPLSELLSKERYILNQLTLKSLREDTKADSIVLPDGKDDLSKQIVFWQDNDKSWRDPIYPGKEGQTEFWKEFKTVLTFRKALSENPKKEDVDEANNKWRWPDQWSEWEDFSLEKVALAVKGEYPASLQANYIEEVYKSDEAKMENFILDLEQYKGNRSRSHTDFIGLQVLMADINTWTFRAVARENFMLKWHYGMPRPEEIAYLIACKTITTDDGVPKGIVESVMGLNLNSPYDFTPKQYRTGCPTHPSFPAMHSAGSTLSTWLPALFNISPEQYREALLIDHGVAMGRTVAGVHYVQDNLAGLNIGQRIIRKELPEYMEVNFKYDLTKVEKRLGDLAFKNRLDDLAFDWNDFDSKVCKNNVTECPIVRKYVDLYNKSNQVDFVFSTEQQTSEE